MDQMFLSATASFSEFLGCSVYSPRSTAPSRKTGYRSDCRAAAGGNARERIEVCSSSYPANGALLDRKRIGQLISNFVGNAVQDGSGHEALG
jgi:hypothetical protein